MNTEIKCNRYQEIKATRKPYDVSCYAGEARLKVIHTLAYNREDAVKEASTYMAGTLGKQHAEKLEYKASKYQLL